MKIIKSISYFGLLLLFVTSLSSQNFTGSFDLIASQTNKSGNTRTDTISYHFDENRTAIIIHAKRNQPDLRMVFSFEDTTITSLFEINGKKGGYILPMDDEHWPGMSDSHYDISKIESKIMKNYTGQSKEIEGHKCREVKVENSEYKATMWLCNDLNISMLQVLSYQSVGKGKSKKELELFKEFGINTLPLVLELQSKADKPDVSITLVNFQTEVDEAIFSTDGHDVSKVE